MKNSTKQKYINIIKEISESGLTISQYIKTNNKSKNLYNQLKQANEAIVEDSELNKTFSYYYNIVTKNKSEKSSENNDDNLFSEFEELEDIDNDQKNEVKFVRGEDGLIKYYQYKIFKKNKRPLFGRLTCEEMNTVYRLYTYYGDNLTARVVSRYFTDLSLPDFKRILRAFNIYKDSSPFPPHMYEQYSENELRDIQLREKENSFMRKAEEDRIKDQERLLKKYAQENIDLRKQLENISNIKIEISNIESTKIEHFYSDEQSINIYLSDMHIGAAMNSGSLYDENINYGPEEVKRRLTKMIEKLDILGTFETINLVLLGDQTDCCGVYGKTASLTHDLSENMDVRKQANTYIETVLWFIKTLITNNMCNNLSVYSVPNGNHSGEFEYVANKAIMYAINALYPEVKTELWEKDYGVFRQNDHIFVCMHGKALWQKKGFPLNIDEKTKVLIYEWLEEQGITGRNIHIIKGDLHSNNMNSCLKFDYRNVLSLFGSSDYGANFSRNSYGVSYDLFIGDNLVRGTFENM